jgi:hypothetical protein
VGPRRVHAVVTMALVSVLGATVAQAGMPTGTVGAADARRTEPIVLSGTQLAAFAGAPTGAIRLRTWGGSDWMFVHGQVDERDASERFVRREDGKLDANDEVVFMADRLGVAAPADAWPGNLTREHPRLEVLVTDPLEPAYRGYAYVFWADQTSPGLPAPLVRFDAANYTIVTDAYALGLAGGDDHFIGLKRLSLFDSANLVDRLKMRVTVSLFGLPATYTEETIGTVITAPRREPLVSGPVRLLFDAAGMDVAYAARWSLFGSLGRGAGSGLVDVTAARLSLDLAPAAVPAVYRDPNVPAGVPVDGRPDAVPSAPVPTWHEVRFTAGRLVSVGAPAPAGSSLRLYYKDDAKVDGTDTGDKMSYGDCGVSATRSEDASGPPPMNIVLGPGDETRAEDLAAAFQRPLVAAVRVDAPPTPATVPATPVVTTPTVPPTVAPTAPPTASAPPPATTPPPAAPPLYMPWLGRGASRGIDHLLNVAPR